MQQEHYKIQWAEFSERFQNKEEAEYSNKTRMWSPTHPPTNS